MKRLSVKQILDFVEIVHFWLMRRPGHVYISTRGVVGLGWVGSSRCMCHRLTTGLSGLGPDQTVGLLIIRN